jgi:O-antigen/teichoic acid export membrane protein
VNSAAKAISFQGLKRRALSLGAVKAFDHAMHFLLPIVLARSLDAHTFGEYRLLWLAVGTLMTLATLNMAGGLYYFVPRSDAKNKRLYIHQTLLYFAGAGLLCAWLVSPWNVLAPQAVRQLEAYGWLVPAFVGLWFLASLLDVLPTVEEKIRLQAYATVSVSVLRTAMVALGAWATGSLEAILWLLLALAAIKLAMLLVYIEARHGLGRPWFSRNLFAGQFRHCAPFGVSSALYALRGQSDQWIAASLFALSSFAAFSIAALVGQVVHIFRHSVMEAFLPSMSRLQAAGDLRGMMEMNRRGNAIVGLLLYPLLALAFAFAEEIITIVYTPAYLEAAPVMRVYIVGMAVMVIETGSVTLLLREGPFAMRTNVIALAFSLAVSWTGAHLAGLPGAALGSVLAVYLDRAILLRRVAQRTGIRFARIQDWRALGGSLAGAAASAALAWALVERFLADSGPLVRVVAGGAVLAAAYGLLTLRRRAA